MDMHRNVSFLALSLYLLTLIQAAASLQAQAAGPEVGKCGRYADAFHGKKTASGELYNKNDLTACHKAHPFGTILRITRLDNKKSVEVRVNDRGPYMSGYIVDVSGKAADILGLSRDGGVAKVKVEVVGSSNSSAQGAGAITSSSSVTKSPGTSPPATTPKGVSSAAEAATRLAVPGAQPSNTQTQAATSLKTSPTTYSTPSSVSPSPTGASASSTLKVNIQEVYQIEIKSVPARSFGVQLTVLTSTDNLFKEIKRAQGLWPQRVIISHEKAAGSATFKILIGPYSSRKEAEAQQKVAAKKGYPKGFIVEFE